MTSKKSDEKTLKEQDYVYDFTVHPLLWFTNKKILNDEEGGLLRKAINYTYIAFLVGVHVYFLLLAAITIATVRIREIQVAASLFAWISLVNVGILLARYTNNDSLQEALEEFQAGVFQYTDAEGRHNLDGPVKRRVAQVRRFVSHFNKFCCLSGFLNTYFTPVLAYLKSDPSGLDLTSVPLNPYLPLPVVCPFPTSTLGGYIAGLISESLYMVILWLTFMGHQELFLSLTLQLCGQLERLAKSLEQLEERGSGLEASGDTLPQTALYLAFRENVLHHIAIIRLYNKVLPYLESVTFFIVFGSSFLMAVETFIYLQNPRENVPMLFFLLSDLVGLLVMMSGGQLLADKSVWLGERLYATPWTSSEDRRLKSSLGIILTRSHRPLDVKARYSSIRVCLETFADIVSAGYKMVNVLR